MQRKKNAVDQTQRIERRNLAPSPANNPINVSKSETNAEYGGTFKCIVTQIDPNGIPDSCNSAHDALNRLRQGTSGRCFAPRQCTEPHRKISSCKINTGYIQPTHSIRFLLTIVDFFIPESLLQRQTAGQLRCLQNRRYKCI